MIDLSYPYVIWGGTFICLFLFVFGVTAYSFKLRATRKKYKISESKFRQDWEYLITPILIQTEALDNLAKILESVSQLGRSNGVLVQVFADRSYFAVGNGNRKRGGTGPIFGENARE